MKKKAGTTREGKLHDWHRRVPKPLLRSGPRWRGTEPPKNQSSPEVKDFLSRRDEYRAELLNQLAETWKLTKYPRNSDKFYAELAINLLQLFPAWQVRWETRGKSRQSVIEPESLARTERRTRRGK